ncbi:FecCD family ABC transporter permease [Rhodospirillum rubrum]|uniref:Transport system permease protein n=1 Tax=Rhodospirillum rubrum (strain ATCC 11170 / ATH 1.1.1 / DSM 467 / LMG 4362 / NCIMB 8255 / S1) TaxID=269796 RepID=Q2RPC8_RHORT|nr:iron ABC transporter permease [Rhodospirillum rubrum]ABC24017.1 transport system permease protein [Rhodospirillum rubrum ATCC 11170]AEO49762.1 transport system permease protein [Rhodospirillum rubrum F11]MBK5955701.1 iron ABC transporter permease [Rhodospirillum rubrum]QXG79960.1 iron ABC transporter permease [Rhodospirillum rubrum]HAP98700.1 iron ABC transporter permease [Rhodospirillum rubrum]
MPKGLHPPLSRPFRLGRAIPRTALGGALCLVVTLTLISFAIGPYGVAPGKVLAILASRALPGLAQALSLSWTPEDEVVVMAIRLPRILGALLVGAALATSGATFQGLFRNPLVSPDLLGAAAGAGCAAAAGLLLGLGGPAIQGLAFLGGLAAVGLTCLIAKGRGGAGDGPLMMVLTGLIVGTVFSAFIGLIKTLADPDNTLPAITFWLMGSLSAITLDDIALAAPPIGCGVGLACLLRWRLNALAFGDDEARALGIDVGRVRLAAIVAATLMTAAAVAIAGIIGLVGLVVPHMTRMLLGPNHAVLLPACALLGGAFLLGVDDLARSLGPTEIPLGILTALIGAPLFLALLPGARRGWR